VRKSGLLNRISVAQAGPKWRVERLPKSSAETPKAKMMRLRWSRRSRSNHSMSRGASWVRALTARTRAMTPMIQSTSRSWMGSRGRFCISMPRNITAAIATTTVE